MSNLELKSVYRLKTGTRVFVYYVNCTEKQKEQYIQQAGTEYRESDEGKPLFFTTKNLSKNPKCKIVNGKIVNATVDLL